MADKKRTQKQKNPIAKSLRGARFHMRTVRAKKGKGSYRRNPKHRHRDGGVLVFKLTCFSKVYLLS